jgi:hypothetical protein
VQVRVDPADQRFAFGAREEIAGDEDFEPGRRHLEHARPLGERVANHFTDLPQEHRVISDLARVAE